jgi:hypothetical protein
MLTTLAMLAIGQAPIPAPVLPAGCSPAFQRTVIAVEKSLEAGDFVTAAKQFQLLPKTNPTITFKDASVPAAKRDTFRQSLAGAISGWQRVLGQSAAFKLGSPPDVLIDFGDEMAKPANSDIPAGVALFLSETTAPRVEAVIGLKRGADHRPSNEFDVQNDIAYALGAYLGVAHTTLVGSVMGHIDTPSISLNGVVPNEIAVVRENLKAVEALRSAIHSKTRMAPGQPIASLDTKSLTYGPVLQGEQVYLNVGLTNVGTGSLTYFIRPECSCIAGGPGGALGPGQSRSLEIRVDTTTWDRTMQKNLMLLTNDPETPVQEIPLQVKVEPRYRWIVPGGPNFVVGDKGADVDLYLDIPLNANIVPTKVRFEGIAGKVQIQPWSGTLADPDRGEPARPRDGYKLKVHVDGDVGPGRPPGSVVVETANQEFSELRYTLGFQKGIVAFPDSINLGLIGKIQHTHAFFLSRPGQPFKIVSMSATPATIRTAATKIEETGDYRVSVDLDGKVPPGDFLGVIHIVTDDPKQPKIDIPVRGLGG